MQIKSAWLKKQTGTKNLLKVFPGIALAVFVTILASSFHDLSEHLFPFVKSNPISTVTIAIVFGMIIRNIFLMPDIFQYGIKFCLVQVLRLGIVLLGIRLSILAAMKIGIMAFGIVLACIGTAVLVAGFLAKKMHLGVRLGALIAVGTSICGVTAIVATGPLINAEEEKVSYAVSTITIFGTLAMFIYPYVIPFLTGFDTVLSGIFLGTAVHDTSQVASAGLIYDSLWNHGSGITATDTAIVTKLVRNTMMIWVIPVIGYLTVKKLQGRDGTQDYKFKRFAVPGFVLGFLAMVLVRTVGDYLIIDKQMLAFIPWEWVVTNVKSAATNLLLLAVAGIGLNTDLRKLTRLGPKPFFVGLATMLTVGAVSFFLIWTVHHFVGTAALT